MSYHKLKAKLEAKLEAKGAGSSSPARPEPKFEDDDDDNEIDPKQLENEMRLAELMIAEITEARQKRTRRFVGEDPNADRLFENVAGYKENLKKPGQKDKPPEYKYPPGWVMMGPDWSGKPREPGEDAAADELFKDVDKDKHARAQAEEDARDADAARRTMQAMQTTSLALSSIVGKRTVRYEGEDPNAEKLFEDVPGFKRDLRPASEAPKVGPSHVPSGSSGEQSGWEALSPSLSRNPFMGWD
ncbi:hypothetical protein VP1G_03846 [Cytospora mali]|uniref:Uncharacterized protein n=1 Tax=Cytospora mali TaxID=578113 RepID=A0A194UXP9_CYTMA|nr:hypothetical protein VP1G_03846 [Valsa mali var. pyri (nom. inval.)]